MDIKYWFPYGSKTFQELNSHSVSSYTDPKSSLRDGALAKNQAKKGNSPKCMVSITSYRVRLADVEGLCGKWHLDALRYAGVIEDDTEEAISYQISQKKVAKKTQEKTLIVVTYAN